MNTTMKALVLSSGGVDSTTALGLAVKKYGPENVITLSVFYGQKHDRELQAAKAVAGITESGILRWISKPSSNTVTVLF